MPVYPGMPYAHVSVWAFTLFELSIVFLFALCLLDGLRRGRGAVPYLLGGMCFGLLLEYLEVASHSYTYGHFWLMLGRAPLDIPICIGLAWGIILYTARLFSDSLRFPWIAAAALDTLLALNIDLTMDVVAYRMHLWHWDWTGSGLDPLRADWFGIPYGNFAGWITVVFCYSFFSRLFERKVFTSTGAWRFAAVAALALIASQLVLLVTEYFVFGWLNAVGVGSGRRLILECSILLAIAWRGGIKRRRSERRRVPPIAVWVPVWFHAYFGIALFALGFFRENKWMTLVAIVNVAMGLMVHLLAASGKRPGEGSAPFVWAAAAQ